MRKEERVVLKESLYKTEVKYGKLGEEFSHTKNTFKNPVIQIAPGSVLNTSQDYVGEMLSLSKGRSEILDYNYGFLLPFNTISNNV